MREGKRERDIIKGDRDLEVKLKRKDENLIKIFSKVWIVSALSL